jgi:methionyl-tRNA formyltransferase
VLTTADFSEASNCEWVGKLSPELGLFTGGGVISSALLSRFSVGVLNIHMGHLPRFKGMDMVEWPLLEGRFGNVGGTAHLMDAGIDTGPVLQRFETPTRQFAELGALRSAIGGLMPLVSVDTALGIKSGRLAPLPQTQRGQQYFFVHHRLQPIVEKTLALRTGTDGKRDDSLYKNVLYDLSAVSAPSSEKHYDRRS